MSVSNVFNVADPVADPQRCADEMNCALLLDLRICQGECDTPAEGFATIDLARYRGKLYERCDDGTWPKLTPERLEARLSRIFAWYETFTPECLRRETAAQVALDCWNAWGRRLPPGVATLTLKTARTWPSYYWLPKRAFLRGRTA